MYVASISSRISRIVLVAGYTHSGSLRVQEVYKYLHDGYSSNVFSSAISYAVCAFAISEMCWIPFEAFSFRQNRRQKNRREDGKCEEEKNLNFQHLFSLSLSLRRAQTRNRLISFVGVFPYFFSLLSS